jgi:type IV secretory pathway VirB10-like protein
VSKPAIILVLGVAATALAIAFSLFPHDDTRRKRTAPAETQESIAEPTPSVLAEAALEPPPPLPAPAPTSATRPPKPPEPPPPDRLDEASLIAELHDLAASNPPQSLKLAREALARFPSSPHAPEFEWNVVKALANMDRYQEAEEEARGMLEKYPDNPLSVDVEHHVLNHPPNPPGAP